MSKKCSDTKHRGLSQTDRQMGGASGSTECEPLLEKLHLLLFSGEIEGR